MERRAGSVVRRLREAQARNGLEERLVWILGSPRSGSTWLLYLLGEDKRVVPINEPLIGWYLGPLLSDLPGFETSTLDSHNFTLRQAQRDKRNQFFSEPFRDVWLPSLRSMMLRRFAAQVSHSGSGRRPLVLVKEPNGSQSADLLLDALPRSRLLFLLRDGRDVVDSELAANLKGSWATQDFPGAEGIAGDDRLAFVAQSARKWLWRTEVVERAYEAHRGPRLTLRYEALRRDPETVLPELFEWLGIPVSPEVLRERVRKHAFEQIPEQTRGPQSFYRSASPGSWRQNLTLQEQDVVQEILGPKLQDLGYD